MRATSVTTDALERYKGQRRAEGAAPATVNRELATLRRAFNYGKRSTPPKVYSVPYIQMFKENNARQGFVVLIEVAYTYGWRRGEMLGLQVRQVDLLARTIRLDPGTTKNGEGREVVMTPEVEELLRAAVANKKPKDSVFTREDGKPIKDFRGAWRNLCVRAGTGRWECRKCGVVLTEAKCECSGVRKYAGLIPHDFRRSAAKAARRAGVPESVIMAMGGWKTPSMFRRYAIVSSADQLTAVEMIARERAEKAISPPFSPSSAEVDSPGAEPAPSTVQ
jgi:integrase